MSTRILQGDCRNILPTLADKSFHCCVTSPPYWGLRDYGHADQIGQEATPREYVEALVGVFREVRRVLRDDGTLWVNLGDSYAGSWGAQSRPDTTSEGGLEGRTMLAARQIKAHPKGGSGVGSLKNTPGLKNKDLIGIPWRVAFALQDDGWFLRSDIIWAKPNPLPESVLDRPTKAHEYMFLFSKSERYCYDAASIAEMATNRPPGNKTHKSVAAFADGDDAFRTKAGLLAIKATVTRNARSVWTIPTEPYDGAHFAVMPTALVKPCILAGCSEGGTVLDPFGGSGTVGRVAADLGRHSVLIELNPDYVTLAEKRTAQQGLFAHESMATQ